MSAPRRGPLDPLGEAALRRALRLEADELPRRIDPAAIVRAARREPVAVTPAAVASAILAAAAVAAAVGIGEDQVLPSVPASIVDAGVAFAVSAGVPVWQLLSAFASPTPAIVSLAAVVFAVVHERSQRRERAHVHAS